MITSRPIHGALHLARSAPIFRGAGIKRRAVQRVAYRQSKAIPLELVLLAMFEQRLRRAGRGDELVKVKCDGRPKNFPHAGVKVVREISLKEFSGTHQNILEWRFRAVLGVGRGNERDVFITIQSTMDLYPQTPYATEITIGSLNDQLEEPGFGPGGGTERDLRKAKRQ